MKKLLYTLLAVSLIFSSCKKEEENINNTQNSTPTLIGQWSMYELEMSHLDNFGSEYFNHLIPDTTLGIISIIWDFSSNGLVYKMQENLDDGQFYIDLDTISYIQGTDVIYLTTQHSTDKPYQIITLTSTQLELFNNEDPNNFERLYFNKE
jgi:hypothetical protein